MLLNLVFGKNKTVTAELPPKEAEMLFMAAAMYIEDTYADDFDDEDCGCCEDCEEDEDFEEDENFEEDRVFCCWFGKRKGEAEISDSRCL